MNVQRVVPRLLLIVGIALVVTLATLNRDRFEPAALDAWLAGMGIWAPIAYVGFYVAGTVFFLPGSLFSLAGGVIFGPVWGVLLNLLGATIGASLAFLVARYLAGDWVARKAAGRLKRLIEGVEAESWRFIAFVRLVPLFPFNLTNYALGLTRIGFLPYVITSLICMAPGATAYTWLGHAGREALAGDASAVRYGLLALGLLAAIAFLPRLIKRLRQSRTAWIEADELHHQLLSGTAPAILDVRGSDEFADSLGHIADSANIPIDELPHRLSEIGAWKDNPVTLVCRTDRRSATAHAILRNAGFRNVAVLRGGTERWNALGFETEPERALEGRATQGVAAIRTIP